MSDPYVIPLAACSERSLVGGKAAGLGRLIGAGYRVPPGLCLTTAAYREALRAAGAEPGAPPESPMIPLPPTILQALDRAMDRLEEEARAAGVDPRLWAVRSSATEEDGEGATFGGLFRTLLAVPRPRLAEAIARCWASLCSPEVQAYRARRPPARHPPAMAVVIQPLLAPRAAGVAYSRDPLTGAPRVAVVNAVRGLAEPLVAGLVTPEQALLTEEGGRVTLAEREPGRQGFVRLATAEGLIDRPLAPEERSGPALTDEEAIALARLAWDVERTLGRPADIEWALDPRGLWLLQARGIPALKAGRGGPTLWSRANFKETLPELPSPLALSFLDSFMEHAILRHYREAGCEVPEGRPSVQVVHGRPYINVTLFQDIVGQLRGDPSLVTEQMGGEAGPLPAARPLPWPRLVRAHLVLGAKVLAAARRAPAWFAELRRMGEEEVRLATTGTDAAIGEAALLDRIERLHRRVLEGDLTFGIVGGVSRDLYLLGLVLSRRLPDGWRPLLNAATRGLGTIISAQQILGLADLARVARDEPAARRFFLEGRWEPAAYRSRLAGTKFLEGFDRYLADYGHRAIGESDIMMPRFAEMPDYLLGVVRGHLEAGIGPTEADRRERQEAARREALDRIRRAFGRRRHEWLWFRWWYRSLCRYLSLREANRHHQMYYQACSRRVLLTLGARLVQAGRLGSAEDLFFLTAEEIRALVLGRAPERGGTWRGLVAARRAEREAHAARPAPDTLARRPDRSAAPSASPPGDECLTGLPISSGTAEGPIRLVATPEDARRVRPGDILLVPVIDPGLAPLLGLAAGLIADMGGTLSHGAIIAREYGLPAVANVAGATGRLKDGERVRVDADRGLVTRLGRPGRGAG